MQHQRTWLVKCTWGNGCNSVEPLTVRQVLEEDSYVHIRDVEVVKLCKNPLHPNVFRFNGNREPKCSRQTKFTNHNYKIPPKPPDYTYFFVLQSYSYLTISSSKLQGCRIGFFESNILMVNSVVEVGERVLLTMMNNLILWVKLVALNTSIFHVGRDEDSALFVIQEIIEEVHGICKKWKPRGEKINESKRLELNSKWVVVLIIMKVSWSSFYFREIVWLVRKMGKVSNKKISAVTYEHINNEKLQVVTEKPTDVGYFRNAFNNYFLKVLFWILESFFMSIWGLNNLYYTNVVKNHCTIQRTTWEVPWQSLQAIKEELLSKSVPQGTVVNIASSYGVLCVKEIQITSNGTCTLDGSVEYIQRGKFQVGML